MVEDKKGQAEAQKKEEAEKARKVAEAESHRRRTDTNYNPLLQNGITNKDVSHYALYIADLPNSDFSLQKRQLFTCKTSC